MFKGFRDFILRGNVMDLAVAFIMGEGRADAGDRGDCGQAGFQRHQG